MEMKVMLDPGAKLPTRAHEYDGGLDLYSPTDALIYNDDSVEIDTGVHVQIPRGYVGLILSKSGLNFKHSVKSDGVIDADYTGSIRIKLYNHSRCAVSIQKYQKISQLVIVPIIRPELVLTDHFEDTERGAGGFGSTGAF
jgi:dUTP pyrophosphatase